MGDDPLVLSVPSAKLGTVVNEFDDICSRLEAISEELTDLAISRLQDSIDAGGTELPIDEKRLNRARRSIEKARMILSSDSSGSSAPLYDN